MSLLPLVGIVRNKVILVFGCITFAQKLNLQFAELHPGCITLSCLDPPWMLSFQFGVGAFLVKFSSNGVIFKCLASLWVGLVCLCQFARSRLERDNDERR